MSVLTCKVLFYFIKYILYSTYIHKKYLRVHYFCHYSNASFFCTNGQMFFDSTEALKLCKVMLDNEVLHKLVESILVHAVIKGTGDIESNRYDCFLKI